MSAERILWLIVGVVLLVFAIISLFGDGLNIEQKTMDAIQNIVLAIFAFGLAWRSGPYVNP